MGHGIGQGMGTYCDEACRVSENFKIISLYIFLCVVWGSTWMAIRLGLDSLTPLFAVGARFVVAAVIIYAIMRVRGLAFDFQKNSVYLYIFLAVFSFYLPFAFVYWAEQYIPSGLASVLFAVYPFAAALITWVFLPGETIGAEKIIGIVLGFAGIFIIFSGDLSIDLDNHLLGMIAVVLSGVMQAGVAVTIKKYGGHLHPLSINFVPLVIASVLFMVSSFALEDTVANVFDANGILSVLYLAVFGSVANFSIYFWLLKRINIVLLSLTAFITPITALLLGWLALDETLGRLHLIGSAFVLTAIIIANLRGLQKRFSLRRV